MFLQVLTHLGDRLGWRWVCYATAIAAAGAIPVVWFLIRDRPEDVGATAFGAPPGHATALTTGNPIRAAWDGLQVLTRSGGFWLLFGGFLVCGVSTNGLIATHFIPAAGDHHHARTTAAGLLALIGVFDIAGTLASGWLTDRVDSRYLLGGYYLMRGLSLFALDAALGAGGASLWVFMVFYGLDWVATVPPTIRLCFDTFGHERGSVAFGWVFAGHQIGAAIMAWLAGYLRDVTGSYQPAFVIAGVCCVLAAFGSVRIGRPAVASAYVEPALAGA